MVGTVRRWATLVAALEDMDMQEEEDEVARFLFASAIAGSALNLGQLAAILSGRIRFRSYLHRVHLQDANESSWQTILYADDHRDSGFLPEYYKLIISLLYGSQKRGIFRKR